jgi:hypothetical protein
METEGSLPCSQQSVTVPHTESYDAAHNLISCFSTHFNIILSTPGSPKYFIPLRFSCHHILYISHMCSSFPVHFILVDSITLIIFGDKIV